MTTQWVWLSSGDVKIQWQNNVNLTKVDVDGQYQDSDSELLYGD